jgi:hypothetical protein
VAVRNKQAPQRRQDMREYQKYLGIISQLREYIDAITEDKKDLLQISVDAISNNGYMFTSGERDAIYNLEKELSQVKKAAQEWADFTRGKLPIWKNWFYEG